MANAPVSERTTQPDRLVRSGRDTLFGQHLHTLGKSLTVPWSYRNGCQKVVGSVSPFIRMTPEFVMDRGINSVLLMPGGNSQVVPPRS